MGCSRLCNKSDRLHGITSAIHSYVIRPVPMPFFAQIVSSELHVVVIALLVIFVGTVPLPMAVHWGLRLIGSFNP